jgi:hypothetical protein
MKMPGLKFDKDAIGRFFLNHVEKFVVGGVGILGLVLAWNGVNALRAKSVSAEKRPESVAALTADTVRHIDAVAKPPADAMRSAGQLSRTIDPWRPQQVKVAPTPDVAMLSRPVVQQIVRRAEPKAFPVEDLRAIAGWRVLKDQMAEQMANAAAQGGTDDGNQSAANPDYLEPQKRFERLAPYVVLVGLVPVAKQRAEFRRALGTADAAATPGTGDPLQDLPRWGDYVVERAVAADADKPEAWSPIRLRLDADQGGSKPLPERFLLGANDLATSSGESGYAASLPQRLYEPWGLDTIHPWFLQPRHKWRLERSEQIAESPVRLRPADVRKEFADHAGHEVELVGMKFAGAAQKTGSPETVMISVAAADGSESCPPPDATTAPTPDGSSRPTAVKPVFIMSAAWQKTIDLKSIAACDLRVIPALESGIPVVQIIGITPLEADGRQGVEQRDPKMMSAGGVAGGLGGGGGEFGGPMMTGGGIDEGAEYRLFRFIDESVDPGKAYRYRVKVELPNPNYGLDPRMLADQKAAGNELLSSVSEPTATVMLPTPYMTAARASLVESKAAADSGGDSATPAAQTQKSAGPKLGKTQVEVSFLGPTWQHMRGKRADQGSDLFDLAIEHVLPVEPGGSVLWKRSKKPKEKDKQKQDSSAAKATDKPKPRDASWTLLNDADVGRELIDFRGRQKTEAAADASKKDAAATAVIREPVEMAFLRPDGSLEVVTAADSQWVLDAYEGYSAGAPGFQSEPGGGFFGEGNAPQGGLR